MTEDGHVQKVFSAALAMVLHSLEFLNMNPARVALGTGGGSVAAGAISSHRPGSTLASALTLGGPQTYEHCHTLTFITVNLHIESFITDISRLSSTSLSWVAMEPKFHDEPNFDHEQKAR